MLITSNWGQLWRPPFPVLAAVILASVLTAFAAVYAPARKIAKAQIADVLHAG